LAADRDKEGVGAGSPRAGRLLHALVAAALTVALVVLIISHALRTPFFDIRRVNVSSGHHCPAEAIAARVDGMARGNIFRADLDRIAAAVRSVAWAEGVSVRRDFPDTITIDVRERRPAALIDLGRLYYLDEDGRPFAPFAPEGGERGNGPSNARERGTVTDEPGLPIVTGLETEELMEPSSPARRRLRNALNLLSVTGGWIAGHRIERVRIGPSQGVSLTIEGLSFEVLLRDDGSKEQLERIEALLARPGAEGPEKDNRIALTELRPPIRLIDMRFRNMAILRRTP